VTQATVRGLPCLWLYIPPLGGYIYHHGNGPRLPCFAVFCRVLPWSFRVNTADGFLPFSRLSYLNSQTPPSMPQPSEHFAVFCREVAFANTATLISKDFSFVDPLPDFYELALLPMVIQISVGAQYVVFYPLFDDTLKPLLVVRRVHSQNAGNDVADPLLA